MDPLVVAQSDLVYVFDLPNEADRKTLAGQIGWDARDLSEDIDDLKPYEYLLFDAAAPKPEGDADDMRLLSFPPLPEPVIARIKQQVPSDV
jgi:hypothetical protein